MAEAADLILRASVAGGREAVATLDQLDASAKRAERSASSLGAEESRLSRMLRQADAAVRDFTLGIREGMNAELAAAKAARQHADALKAQQAAINASNVVNLAQARSARLAGHEVANLSRQLGDVATMAAMGASPMSILTTQGFQLAEIFGMARARGVTFVGALGQIGGAVGGLVTRFAPVALAVGAATAAFALFEREVDKNTKGATTWGDTWQAVINVTGRAIMDGPIGDGLKWLGSAFSQVMDTIVGGAMAGLDRLVGFWGAAFLAITKNWRQLPQVIGAIITAAANNTIAGVEWMINKVAAGVNRLAGKELIKAIDLPELKQASNSVAQQFEADQKRIEESFRRTREQFFGAVVSETERLAAAREKADKAAKGHAKSTKDEADALDKLRQAVERVLQSLETPMEKALRETREAMITLRKGLDAGMISTDQFREAIERLLPVVVDVKDAQKAWRVDLEKTPADLAESVSKMDDAIDRANDLARAFSDVRYSLDDMFRSMKSGDIGGFLLNVQGMISGIGTLLSQGPAGYAALGSMAANAIGGRAGRAIGGGLGIAGAGIGLGAFAGTAAGAAALGTIGLSAGMINSIAALAGPIGLAAGALYAAVKLFNIGGKPTNAGAGFDLITGQISGNKRTSETEQAARQAGETIIAIQDSLKAAGIGLTDTVRGLVIGTRDQTQIYLASGRELRSAVGDAGAAVDTALRALLEGATYVSDAQKKLVESAMAAGKGFDEIAEILSKYEAAQGITKNLADAILQLTDPKAYDLKAITDAIEDQRKAAKELSDQGYLTADQLATINGQLSTLEGLQIDEVLKRYTDAVNDNLQEWATGKTDEARAALVDAYNREAQVHREAIDRFRQIADGLRSFNRELQSGTIAANDPGVQYQRTKAEFDRLAALAANDPERLAGLEAAGRAFVEASREVSPTQLAFDRDLQAVRRATEASEIAARDQADLEQQQLDALTAQVELLVQLNTGLLTVAQAIANLQNALAVQQQVGVPANSNVPNIDVTRYLANNPDLAANWMAGGDLRRLGGSLEEAALAHYAMQGQYEIAAGLRFYAAGGDHPGGLRVVGEQGPEIEATGPARYFSASQTRDILSGSGSPEVVAELRRQNALLEEQNALLRSVSNTNQDMNDRDRQRDWKGFYVRGETPDDPVPTVAA